MILKDRIPESFYKLFRTKNMEAYMSCLVAIYEENNKMFDSFGMTEAETKTVIDETIGRLHILWQIDEQERQEEIEDGTLPEESDDMPDMVIHSSRILRRFVRWGWIGLNFDERMNENVISFPEYSQLYIELFERMEKEDNNQERQSIMSVYSGLFTYAKDREKDSHILESVLHTSRDLSQMLSNMQDGMRGYFEELSSQTHFLGIQEVLVAEINNSDSQKYAILTTRDSFYRYKESVRELISQILRENELYREEIEQSGGLGEEEQRKRERMVAGCERTEQLLYRIERECNTIEKKYNTLIRQKTIFAKRALARIHYIMQEGTVRSDSIDRLIKKLSGSSQQEQDILLEQVQEKVAFLSPIKVFGKESLYRQRADKEPVFVPVRQNEETESQQDMENFVPRPLYTRKELQEFKEANMQDGIFVADAGTVKSIEDLEKLIFLWQEASDNRRDRDRIELGEDMVREEGYTYSRIRIKE